MKSANIDLLARSRTLVAVAFALMLLHNLDEAFWHHESGGLINLGVVLTTGSLVVLLYPRMAVPWRVGVLGFLGLDALVQGLVGHVVRIPSGHGSILDVTGILFAAGGALLLDVAVREFRARRRVVAPAPGVRSLDTGRTRTSQTSAR